MRALALGTAFAACGVLDPSLAPNTVVSGWSVGEAIDCSSEFCLEVRRVAEAGVEERYPGHLPVVSLTIHGEGEYRQPDGSMQMGHVAGGCCMVALFRLVDGSMLAFGVGSALIGGDLHPYFEPPFPVEAQ